MLRHLLLLGLSLFCLGETRAQPRRVGNANLYSAVPRAAYQALDVPYRDNLYFKKPLTPLPELYRRTGRDHYRRVALSSLSVRGNASPDELRCWNIFKSGGLDCSKTLRAQALDEDLLERARRISKSNGLLSAREYLETAMLLQDSSHGAFEADVQRASRDKNWMREDSVMKLDFEKRGRIGVFIIFGIDLTGDSPNRELIRRAHNEMLKMGFSAYLLETPPADTYQVNGKIIGEEFEARVKDLDHVLFVAASKGVADLLTYMLNQGAEFSREEREKVRGIFSLSGVVRGSNVAQALMDSGELLLSTSKLVIASRPIQPLKGIEALAGDPWKGHARNKLIKTYPNLNWISVSMLPAGPDALVPAGTIALELQQAVIRQAKAYSPSDGLVETAATILPPNTGIPERIVRGYGPHALALGTFLNGEALAPQNKKGDTVDPEAGAEILSAFMRALSKDILGKDGLLNAK